MGWRKTAAYPSADTIVFDNSLGLSSVTGTIHLTAGELLIDSALSITGPGATRLTIDAAGGSRVVNVDATGSISVNLSGMTITGGSTTGDGGGILNRETLTLTDVTISGNSAGYGGGLRNFETLTVNNSVVANNSANYGGGIDSAGALTVTGSKIRDNTAVQYGGGINSLSFGPRAPGFQFGHQRKLGHRRRGSLQRLRSDFLVGQFGDWQPGFP